MGQDKKEAAQEVLVLKQLQRHEEARRYAKEVLVKEKGLRLYDISRLIGGCRSTISRFVGGENVGGDLLVDQILAFKKRLERTEPVNE